MISIRNSHPNGVTPFYVRNAAYFRLTRQSCRVCRRPR